MLEQRVSSSFKMNDNQALASLFSERLEISLPSQQGVFSKSQSTQIFKTFFSQHRIRSFSIIHKSTEQSTDKFMIAEAKDDQGQAYTVQIYFQQSSNSWLIRKISISNN